MRGSEFEALKAFAVIAEQKSFAKAAKILDIAVSTLSHRLRELEEQQGVRLLNRTTRSVAPTEAGEFLLGQLAPIFAALDHAAQTTRNFRDAPAGKLRLTIPPPAADMFAPLLARFVSGFPSIKLEISVDGSRVDIVRDRYDAGVRFGPFLERDMIALRIGPPVMPLTVASPTYLAERGRPRSPAELRAHLCIRIRLPGGMLLPWRYQRHNKVFELELGDAFVVNDGGLELRAALDGGGIAYLLSNRVASFLEEGRLVALLDDYAVPPSNFFLYYPSRRQLPPPIQAFIEFVRKEGLITSKKS